MGKKRIKVKKRNKNERHIITAVIVGVVLVIILLFSPQIKNMVQSITGGPGHVELSGTDIIFEVGKNYQMELVGGDNYRIEDINGQYVVFAEVEYLGNQMRVYEDKEGKRHKFFVSGSATYMGPVE